VSDSLHITMYIKIGETVINISKLNVGIYLIKFKDNSNNISISKFIKN
jgi:hypothetical protein